LGRNFGHPVNPSGIDNLLHILISRRRIVEIVELDKFGDPGKNRLESGVYRFIEDWLLGNLFVS
jgi:hypothetical protein